MAQTSAAHDPQGQGFREMAKDRAENTPKRRARKKSIPKQMFVFWIAAFGKMLEQLREASETHEANLPNTTENERRVLVAALKAVATFVGTFNSPYKERLWNLATIIDDLNRGIRSPLLEPSTPGARHADNSQAWLAKAHLMLAFEALMRVGHTRAEAASAIAERFPELKKLAGTKAGNSDPNTILLNWRREFSRVTPTDSDTRPVEVPDARLLYDEGIDHIDKLYNALEAFGLFAFAEFNLAEASKVCVF
jgi:hypothetical protein